MSNEGSKEIPKALKGFVAGAVLAATGSATAALPESVTVTPFSNNDYSWMNNQSEAEKDIAIQKAQQRADEFNASVNSGENSGEGISKEDAEYAVDMVNNYIGGDGTLGRAIEGQIMAMRMKTTSAAEIKKALDHLRKNGGELKNAVTIIGVLRGLRWEGEKNGFKWTSSVGSDGITFGIEKKGFELPWEKKRKK